MSTMDRIPETDFEKRLQFESLLADLTARFVSLPPAKVHEEIAVALRRLCDFLEIDRSTIWEFDAEDEAAAQLRYAYQVSEGPPLPEVANATDLFPWFNKQARRGEAVVLERLDELPEEASVDRENLQVFRAKSVVVLPLQVGGEAVGIVSFAMIHREKAWAEPIVTRLKLLAQVFAHAIDRRHADLALRNLSGRLIRAHEEERARLARELHDDLTQRLARIAIDLGRLDLVEDEGAKADEMRAVRDGLSRLSADVHTLAYRLHPTIVEDLGLVEALRSECERLARQESIGIQEKLGQTSGPIPRETSLCLFRVAQECLRNVARHARAGGVVVSLSELDGGLQLAVHDDGVGFDLAAHRERGHLGIASMHERVSLLGGRLEFDSAPGKGTTVYAWVPRTEISS